MADAQGNAGSAPIPADEFTRVHHALLADHTLQFKFDRAEPPPPPPDWLIAIARFLEAVSPLLSLLFWGGLAFLAALVVWMVVRAVIRRLTPSRTVAEAEATEAARTVEFKPQRERARALLAEADRLAKEGRFSEAARVLLHRTIEDMEKALSLTIGDDLTSREIAQLAPLSAQGRAAFSNIASAVENSLFGGHPLDGKRFTECRSAYEAFAFGRAQ